MRNEKLLQYNAFYDRLKRLEMHYETCKDHELKAMIYDEILYLKRKLKELEQHIIEEQHQEPDDYELALNMLERIYDWYST